MKTIFKIFIKIIPILLYFSILSSFSYAQTFGFKKKNELIKETNSDNLYTVEVNCLGSGKLSADRIINIVFDPNSSEANSNDFDIPTKKITFEKDLSLPAVKQLTILVKTDDIDETNEFFILDLQEEGQGAGVNIEPSSGRFVGIIIDSEGGADPDFGNDDKPAEDTEGEEDVTDNDSKIDNILSPLFSYNFSGNNNGLANLTPVIDYGWNKNVYEGTILKIQLSVNPYVGSQINVKDSTSFIPALMLPGNVGIRANLFFNFKAGKDLTIGIAPFNVGYKLITNFTDSVNIIAQHNIRHGIILKYADVLGLGFQITQAWHNSTSESELAYEKVLKKGITDLTYLTVTMQTSISKKGVAAPTFLYLEWRSLWNRDSYVEMPNKKIISIGVRKDLNVDQLLPARRANRSQVGF